MGSSRSARRDEVTPGQVVAGPETPEGASSRPEPLNETRSGREPS